LQLSYSKRGFNKDHSLLWSTYVQLTTNGNFFLGKRSKVVSHRSCIAKIAVSFGGITAGERNGERGYMLTFVIAYIRVRKITLYF